MLEVTEVIQPVRCKRPVLILSKTVYNSVSGFQLHVNTFLSYEMEIFKTSYFPLSNRVSIKCSKVKYLLYKLMGWGQREPLAYKLYRIYTLSRGMRDCARVNAKLTCYETRYETFFAPLR